VQFAGPCKAKLNGRKFFEYESSCDFPGTNIVSQTTGDNYYQVQMLAPGPYPEEVPEAMINGKFEVTCEVEAVVTSATGWDPCGNGYQSGITLAEFLYPPGAYEIVGYTMSGMSAVSALYQSTSQLFGFQNKCVDFALDSMRGIFMSGWDLLLYGLEDPVSSAGNAILSILPLYSNMMMCMQ
jgi:hypothetical protein